MSGATAPAPRAVNHPAPLPGSRRVCAGCSGAETECVLDLGASPLANSYLSPADLARPEVHYPLALWRCPRCHLVQVPEVTSAESIFGEYAYFSSFSSSWLEHARDFVDGAVERFGLGPDELVIEVASNDGYLLRNVVERGIPALGIEPAANIAEHARQAGVPTLSRFLGSELARSLVRGELEVGEGEQGLAPLMGRPADLVVANNVFAHVPALADFTTGLRELLAPHGVLTIEVQHLARLIEQTQFDTVYHEHYSYYSLHAARGVLARHGLEVFDVEELPTHGGSLRLYCRRAGGDPEPRLETTSRVAELLERERDEGLLDAEVFRRFAGRVVALKHELLGFLLAAAGRGERVVAYGAPAKGNTLLNYCGVGTDLVEFTVDRSPHKQGSYLPGSRLPILAPERLLEARPDWVLILPWNLRDEIREQMAAVEEWGGRFLVAVPRVEIVGD